MQTQHETDRNLTKGQATPLLKLMIQACCQTDHSRWDDLCEHAGPLESDSQAFYSEVVHHIDRWIGIKPTGIPARARRE
jgi:hypothetical protein